LQEHKRFVHHNVGKNVENNELNVLNLYVFNLPYKNHGEMNHPANQNHDQNHHTQTTHLWSELYIHQSLSVVLAGTEVNVVG
jgi:hypothetical protein